MGNSAPKIDPKEAAKENKRVITRAIRSLERERKKLQNQEAKTLKEIKALAQKNQHSQAKIMSKDLVRSRQQINMYYTMASQMGVVQSQLAAAQMNAQMVESLQGVNSVMSQVNGSMNPQQMQNIMKQFAMETEKMGMQQEMMNDQFDMMGDPETDEQADEVYNQILGEVGMNMNEQMATNTNAIAGPAAAQGAAQEVSNIQSVYSRLYLFEIERSRRWPSSQT